MRDLITAGNYIIDLNLVKEGSTVISAGIGRCTKFEEFLMHHKKCKIIAIDPTDLSEKYALSKFKQNDKFVFIKKALFQKDKDTVTFHERREELIGTGPENDVCESFMTPTFVKADKQRLVEAVHLEDICESEPNISCLKMDIEGAEYPLIQSLEKLDIPQVTLEFHFYNSGFSKIIKKEEQSAAMRKMKVLGYNEYKRREKYNEFTFFKAS